MSPLSQYLPLSRQPEFDESDVSDDWRPLIADTLDQVGVVLNGLSVNQWDTPSAVRGWSIRDVARHLIWRLDASAAALVRSALRIRVARLRGKKRPFPHELFGSDTLGPDAIINEIRRIAGDRRALRGRKHVSEAAVAVVHAYDIAHPLGVHLRLAPLVTGAVALRRALTAPTPIKAVIAHRTVLATDAGWQFGRGAEFSGTAEELILFLYGRCAAPPPTVKRPSSR
jgi:uncharacterized protein (TIGR03083 family)